MIRADLHVHSKPPGGRRNGFFKRPVPVSPTQKSQPCIRGQRSGHGFCHITDHNTIEGACELVQTYPDDTFISVETTTYFPETNCKIHLLLYDISPEQFARIQDLRRNIYNLRDYVRDNGLHIPLPTLLQHQ